MIKVHISILSFLILFSLNCSKKKNEKTISIVQEALTCNLSPLSQDYHIGENWKFKVRLKNTGNNSLILPDSKELIQGNAFLWMCDENGGCSPVAFYPIMVNGTKKINLLPGEEIEFEIPQSHGNLSIKMRKEEPATNIKYYCKAEINKSDMPDGYHGWFGSVVSNTVTINVNK